MKKAKILFTTVAVTLGLAAVPAFAYGPEVPGESLINSQIQAIEEKGAPVTVHVDGRYVPTDAQPKIQDGRTFLPMRAVAEAIGAEVNWDGTTQCVTVKKEATQAQFFVGKKNYTVNGKNQTLLVAPINDKGRVLVPIRDFAEAVKCEVNWDAYTASIDITTGGPVAEAPSLPKDTPEYVRWLVEKYYVPAGEDNTGSWMSSYESPDGKSSGQTYYFISKMQNGAKNMIEISATRNYSLLYGEFGDEKIGYGGVDVKSYQIFPKDNGYAAKLTFSDLQMPYDWYVYYKAPTIMGVGGGYSIPYFEINGSTLTKIGQWNFPEKEDFDEMQFDKEKWMNYVDVGMTNTNCERF